MRIPFSTKIFVVKTFLLTWLNCYVPKLKSGVLFDYAFQALAVQHCGEYICMLTYRIYFET
ncbi:hypothetical protein HZS_3934 [Henneguya salminicola]|nr:hypothetical protein HZS_3934 [Henneguya salminicola]